MNDCRQRNVQLPDDAVVTVRCPVCNSRILDRKVEPRIEVYATEGLVTRIVDFYVKCWKCKAKLGAQITE